MKRLVDYGYHLNYQNKFTTQVTSVHLSANSMSLNNRPSAGTVGNIQN